MAERRMFSKKITDSDAFIELSSSAQALYFHLNQGADDDGFNNQIQNAMFKSHSTVDDLKVLMMKNFIIRFDSGVIVIKHWRLHNTLRKDRYKETNFREELKALKIKENGSYTLKDENGCQVVAKRLPQNSIDKNSIDEVSIDKDISENEIKEITKTYEENIGLLTPASAELLFSYLEDISSELIVQAIKIATQRNKRSAKYIEGILKDWILKGYKVLADIQNENNSEKKESVEQKKEYQEIEMTEEEFYSTGAKKNYE